MTSRRAPTFVLALTLATIAGPARAEQAKKEPAVPREGIETIEARLDRAVDRVSLPQFARLIGRTDSARGYRLPGYGLVFVLTPRALPTGGTGTLILRTGRSPHHLVRVETPADVPTSASRGRAPADVPTSASRGRAPADVPTSVSRGRAPADVPTSASRGHARREPPDAPAVAGQDPEEQQIEDLERQVLALQAETEEARRAAEEEMDRLVQDVRILRVAPSGTEAPPPPPEAPDVPSPSAPVVAPPAPPPAPEAPLPASPPWKFWFEASTPDDARTPEALVADVRAAVIDALEVPGGTLPGLGGDEFITVAVDFVPGGLFAAHARPQHTLVVRARVKDVQARGRGAITPEELRQRVQVVEY
jgi:hypothetical protein